MAQQGTSNVESQVGQSVVDSTTDVDATKTATSLTSGENSEDKRIDNQPQEKPTQIENGHGENCSGENENIKPTEEPRTMTPGVGEVVDSDVDGASGSGSPTKAEHSEGASKAVPRTSSVKKPQSFKPMSINRHFLEKTSSTGSSVPTKLTFSTGGTSTQSSGSATPQSQVKPRLVAKTTSGLRDSSPGTGLGTSGTGGTKNLAEAQRAVWNKNQPPPVVPPKEVSDEELKRTYGIHLASRLQPDEIGKESKWADEVDDDDWVPEAIEWNDGTKVALQPEPAAKPTKPVEVSALATAPEETATGPKMLVFSRDSKKSTDPAPVEKTQPKDVPPVRASPWAPVPPVTPVPLAPLRTESRISDSGISQHAHSSSREYTTDDFNRSWRDRQGSNRELFNSETGQLEPVQDRRNRGLRNPRADLQLNKTQVLQRPSSQLAGPAEPSPAFQQSRTSSFRQDDYRRRRTSSNVSGGSGSMGRRLSFNKGMHNLDHPLTPDDGTFPPSSGLHAAQEAMSTGQTESGATGPLTPQSATAPIPQVVEFEDPIAKQQRIMKEARELARKRKQEEEEREEAAKKERLRLKLEQLEAKIAAEKAAQVAQVAQAAQAALEKEKQEEQEKQEKQEEEARAAAAEKAKADAAALAATASVQASANAPDTKPSQPSHSPHSPAAIGGASPHTPSFPPPHVKQNTYNTRSPTRNFASPHTSDMARSPVKPYVMPANRDPKDTHWRTATPPANERYGGWGNTNNRSQPSNNRANPWGPVGDKSRYPALDGVRNEAFHPPQYPSYSHQESVQQPHPPPMDLASNSPQPIPNRPEAEHNFSPIMHPAPSPVAVPSTQNVARPPPVNHWTSYPAHLQKQEAEEREHRKLQRASEASFSEPAEAPRIVETWRKVEVRSDQTTVHRNVTEQVMVEIPPNQSVQPQVTNGYANHVPHRLPPHRDISSTQSIPTGPSSTRQMSRFFPGPNTSSVGQIQPPHMEESALSRLRAPASPPPPTCPVNEVYGERPIPSVRLPPVMAMHTGRISPSPRANGAHRLDTPRSPRVADIEVVQQKIQAVIEKGKEQQLSPTKSFVTPARRDMPGALSAKPIHDDPRPPHLRRSAAATLSPQSVDLTPSTAAEVEDTLPEDVCTKPNEEELFANLYVQDFGSQPTVKLPNITQHSTFIPAPPPSTPSKGRQNAKFKLAVSSVPSSEHLFNRNTSKEGVRTITIRLPLALDVKEIPFNFPSPQPKPKRAPNMNSRNKRGNNPSYNRESPIGGYGGSSRNSFRPGIGRSIAEPVQ